MNDPNVDHDVQAIAVLVGRIRGRNIAPGGTWDYPGVKDAVTKTLKRARDHGYDDPVGVAGTVALRIAMNRQLRTPAMMYQAGDHWRFDDPQQNGMRPPRTDEQCPRHLGKFRGHADCNTLAELGDEPLGAIDLEQAGMHPKDIALRLAAEGRERLQHATDRQETT